MSRFSGPGAEYQPVSWTSGAGSPRQRVKVLKRKEANERNEATPPERRRSTREESAGRKLVKGRWTS